MARVKILFVCLGNICRSPTAEGVFRRMLEEAGASGVHVDSCGTGDWHVGEPPDERTVKHALRRGYDLAPLRARVVTDGDFLLFDRILAMDQSNLRALKRRCPPHLAHKLGLFLDSLGPDFLGREVPDPWHGGPEGFEEVLDLVERACRGLLKEILVSA
jgi:protein-tyrosine phosphatase